MDQYPDEDEEFELLYQDELEMMDEFPSEEQNVVPKSKEQNVSSQPILQSPQFLSQISFGDGESQISAPVNRKLFGTPKEKPKRMASTPLAQKRRMPSIQEVVEDLNNVAETDVDDVRPSTASEALAELRREGAKRKRLEEDLFGNIDDIFGDETYEDPEAKKARTEEEKDWQIIEKILEARRRLKEQNKVVHKDDLTRLKILHDFKMRNLSYTLPPWPFLPLQRSDGERVYVRFHSEQYEAKAIDEIKVAPTIGNLLGDDKQKIWTEANELIWKRVNNNASANAEVAPIIVEPTVNDQDLLWVEKYKPHKYVDLLSDETTNRSLLFWLKMWDKVVFGKEFKALQASTGGRVLNSFNKRTGKFESTGGWNSRRPKKFLDTNVDEFGRPIQKVALLCGPPGLGKTTLAHTIAKQAGYNVREINASDDRSPEAFKLALENGTQMSSVMNEERKPNCIILDEIDGAPHQSIEFLTKFVTDNVTSKRNKVGAGLNKIKRNVLKRPIICICNDLYDPALRTLRQIAFIVTFPPIESSRLAERLAQVANYEHLKTDLNTLIGLAEKSGCDVRCCISTMQFFSIQKKSFTLHDVLSNNLGQKDRHQGLFEVWKSIFKIERSKKQLTEESANKNSLITMTDMSTATRARQVLSAVHSGGDYQRLMQGVFENFLQQKMPDPDLIAVVEASNWFCFSDMLLQQINQDQNYAIYPYLQYGFVKWHLLFASLAWPKINFPHKGLEFFQKSTTQRNVFQSLRKSITTCTAGIGQGTKLLLETVPMLKRILSPQLRSVAVPLLSPREQYDLKHTVEIMADFGITYTQLKSAEGSYVYRMEPDLEALAQFSDSPGITLTYFGRQLIAGEVELEIIKRALPKASRELDLAKAALTSSSTSSSKASAKSSASTNLPNHMQRLKPKQLDKAASAKANQEMVSKDFFGRIQRKTASQSLADELKSDPIVKSPIWYRYKEGFNNAVRKDIHMNELL
ncbi:chromosome transmission fidelity protein 18 homolog isoform 1-T3 [Glossina fuscipes fuscipes]